MTIYNRRDKNVPDAAVYVGRPTKWGNPFVIGLDGDRDEVVTKHRAWLITAPIREDLHELKGKDLVCWCSPEACHAETLWEFANFDYLLSAQER